jgi:hypothetical protein
MLSIPTRGLPGAQRGDPAADNKLDFSEAILSHPRCAPSSWSTRATSRPSYRCCPVRGEQDPGCYSESDVIEPDSAQEIFVTLVTMKLNEINLQLHINIISTNYGQPHVINIHGHRSGLQCGRRQQVLGILHFVIEEARAWTSVSSQGRGLDHLLREGHQLHQHGGAVHLPHRS